MGRSRFPPREFFRHVESLFLQVGERGFHIFGLAVIPQVFQVGQDSVGTFRVNVIHDPFFVIGFGFPFRHGYGASWAIADAGSEAVAKEFAHEACLAVDQLEGAFGAIRHAEPAPVAFFLVDLDYFPPDHVLSPFFVIVNWIIPPGSGE